VKYEIAQLRHLYAQMLTWGGNIPNAARGLLGPAIEALERTEQSRDAIRDENERLDVLRAERDAFRVENERLRGLLREASDLVPDPYPSDPLGLAGRIAAAILRRLSK
jgi:hypothetical protein